jgi:hypothetical protein
VVLAGPAEKAGHVLVGPPGWRGHCMGLGDLRADGQGCSDVVQGQALRPEMRADSHAAT